MCASVRRKIERKILSCCVAAVLLTPGVALAQGGQPPPTPTPTPTATPTPTPAPDPVQEPAVQSAPAQRSNVFNPDTSVIANFVAAAGKNGGPERSFRLTEAELALSAVVDPYARADFFLAATPEGLEVEEGYITFTSLPKSFLLKAGKMRAQFGKVNTLHTHGMPSADRPLVTQNLVGGEEGISDSGVSLSRLFDNPLVFLEATAEVYTGDSEVFQTESRSRLNYVGRLRAYRDITESSNFDLGTSIAWGPTDHVGPDANRRLIGVDAMFRYRPLRRAIYSRFNARTELVWSRQDLPGELAVRAFGMFALAEYQFAQRWYVGARLDRSDRALDATLRDKGASVFLTFWPSEFSQIRGQYRHTRYGEGRRAHEFLVQLSFGIGAHGAHVF
ncbi:MAG TPA: hypothetical protein VMZ90_04480 [Vicinamibacterales bacterium]|nr:hypothetical protein [Vicinamibacterales bacterium]